MAGESPASAAEAYGVQDIGRPEPVDASRERHPRLENGRAQRPRDADRSTNSAVEAVPQLRYAFRPGFCVIGIEAELAYTLARDLPPRMAPYTEADVVATVRSIHAAIEVCDSRLRDWQVADPLLKLADNQMNGALVVGTGMRDWQQIIPGRQVAILEIDGKRCGESVGAHPYGNPLRLLPWLANHCAARCGGLRAGDVITTGAWTGMHFVTAGAEVAARFPGIGEARIAFRCQPSSSTPSEMSR